MPNRVTLMDTGVQVLHKLSEGNPGALTVLAQWLKCGAEIDPDAALPPMLQMLSLDDMDIVGSHIWILYKDVCGQSMHRFIGILRAHQFGYVSTGVLQSAAGGGGVDLGLDELLSRVKARLPRFQIEPPPSSALSETIEQQASA